MKNYLFTTHVFASTLHSNIKTQTFFNAADDVLKLQQVTLDI